MIAFFAQGDPKGQPRPKAFSRAGFTRVYDPATAEGWKAQVALAAKAHLPQQPLSDALSVSLYFWFRRPKSHFRMNGTLKPKAPVEHCIKPDGDNLAKAVLDALTQLRLWEDDAQITSLLILKNYLPPEKNHLSGVKVIIAPAANIPTDEFASEQPVHNLSTQD